MKVISTFSGCGGSSLGYQLAGAKVLLAVEWEQNAVDTYKKNFPDTKVFHGDIKNLSVEKVQELTGVKVGELDVFDGSPPCQGFSMSGKREMNDDRNQLFNEYTRLITGLQPKIFVMENVSGMVKGNMKFVFVEILKELKKCGYKVKAKLLNAKYYKVPQSRQRLIFIGVREDLNIDPSFPIPSQKVITVREAFKNVPVGERKEVKGELKALVEKLKQGESASKYHPKGNYFGSIRLSWNKPSHTIVKQLGSYVFHPQENKLLSIYDLKRLFTFPDNFIFEGNMNNAKSRMGNSVPPNFMKAIALHIKNEILTKCNI